MFDSENNKQTLRRTNVLNEIPVQSGEKRKSDETDDELIRYVTEMKGNN